MLIEACHIEFSKPFVVITGESGSGKSSFVQAIKCGLGAKMRNDWIRRGSDRAEVTLIFNTDRFDPKTRQAMQNFLEELEIPIASDLMLRRTLASNSRAYINDCTVTATSLQKLGALIAEQLDQEAGISLRSSTTARIFFDAYARCDELILSLQKRWDNQREMMQRLDQLTVMASESDLKRDLYAFQVDEIQKHYLQPEREQEIFREYEELATRRESLELISKCHVTLQRLESELSSFGTDAQNLLRILSTRATQSEESSHPLYEPLAQALEALEQLKICSSQLSFAELDDCGEQLSNYEELLKSHDKLKRKYETIGEGVWDFYKKRCKQLEQLDKCEEDLERTQLNAKKLEAEILAISKELSSKRSQALEHFNAQISRHLQDLNLPGAELSARLIPQELSVTGCERIELWLRASPGQKEVPVATGASGGESARIYLALKLGSCQNSTPALLLLDEVDASLGGVSATKLREKLQQLSKTQQILCITHFAQVAIGGDEHLVLRKEQMQEGVGALIDKLASHTQRKIEIERMLGSAKEHGTAPQGINSPSSPSELAHLVDIEP